MTKIVLKNRIMSDQVRFAMSLSLLASVLMLFGKLSAYFLTGSTAIMSDALESIVHIFATSFAAFGLWFAGRPADTDHPYGHGKILLFSVGLEGILVSLAAVLIVLKAFEQLFYSVVIQDLGWGLLIIFGLAVFNLCLGAYLVKIGRRNNQPALIANGQHVLSDMWTSFAVVIGVFVVWVTGIDWLDAVVGLMAAMVIIYTGFSLILQAFNQAMDQASSGDSHEIVNVLESAVREGLIISYHQLRHRAVNNRRWVEVHLLMPGALNITEAHKTATEIEARIENVFDRCKVIVTTHVEPEDHDSVHAGGHPEDPLVNFKH